MGWMTAVGEYDSALKSILTRPDVTVLQRLAGLDVVRWISAELPDVRSRQADLLGETRQGKLAHIELQSTNDSRMDARMLEYVAALYRKFDRVPQQLVLYVGGPPLRMTSRIAQEGLVLEYAVVDIRGLDSDGLLASDSLEDNVTAILGTFSHEIATIRRILSRIAASPESARAGALEELTVLARLRSLVPLLERETERMPILEDIMDHEIIGRERKRGMVIGRDEGKREVILSQLEERFGKVPALARERVEAMGAQELEAFARRLLKAASLEELLD
jgi:predicted transposase YdaD